MLAIMINKEILHIDKEAADSMLLNYLREKLGLTGTKEGCASGDCGACTVVIVDLDKSGNLQYQQVNACITPLHALHGKQVITVEHLKHNGELHPVQKAVVENHGTQCGFCTPGIIMSLYALSRQKTRPKIPSDFLAGNLCRCTGYGPLIQAADIIAAESIENPEYYDNVQEDESGLINWMKSVPLQHTHGYWKPVNRHELSKLRTAHPDARLIAGGTDLALEVTQQNKRIDKMIDLSEVTELRVINRTKSGWRIGAAVPLSELHEFMERHYPSANELFERLGSVTIRNRGTLGGSLGNASPIGDIAPLLISLNGKIEVDNGTETAEYTPEDYITGYKETRLEDDQWISAVLLPDLSPNQKHAIYKVSKRFEDDIATVVLAINFAFNPDQKIEDAIISAGGVATRSVRLSELETMFKGRRLSLQLIREAKRKVPEIISPIDDVRGSAAYRVTLVQNLLQRYYFEYQGVKTRVTDHA